MFFVKTKRALHTRKFFVAFAPAFYLVVCSISFGTHSANAADDLPDKSADPIAELPPAPQANAAAQPSTPSARITAPDAAELISPGDDKRVAPPDSGQPDSTQSDLTHLRVFEETPTVSASTPAKMQDSPLQNPQPVLATARNQTMREVAREKGLTLPLPQARVVIDKSERRLDVMSGSALVKSYFVALGKNPVGAKKSQGDYRTPEGRYYICTRNTQTSDFHIFLGLSYPALPDAKRAVGNKQITPREYQIINQSLASRGRPPWETRLGGWVGIHGGSEGTFAQKQMQKRGSRDWTAGCIGLTNREIEEIYAATKLGTPVEIRP